MPDDGLLQWRLASFWGIAVDEAVDAWHAGHVTEVVELPDDDGLVVATETGGVWIATDGNPQLPLSTPWDSPDSLCVAMGPDGPRHLFAGCADQYQQGLPRTEPVIMETAANAVAPVLSWAPTNPGLPAGAGAVRRIVVIAHLRLIVVACERHRQRPLDLGGVFWARIPASTVPATPGPRAAYVWHEAVVTDAPVDGFFDLTVGSTTGATRRDQLEDVREITIVAGGRSGGIYVGQLVDDELRLAPARQVSGDVVVTVMSGAGASSVASCDGRPNIVLGACARQDGRLLQVVRSEDGGRTWVTCGSTVRGSELFGALLALTGGQGNGWNNRVAVAPYDADLVALGWQAGPFVSQDGGATWEELPDNPHGHSDIHALLFSAATPPDHRTLYVGSDGGLMSIDLDVLWSGGAAPYRSDYNRQSPSLQCYAGLIRQFSGGIDASGTRPGLVSVGLQDNGNAACLLDPEPEPWVRLERGDGGGNRFVIGGALVHNIKGLRAQEVTIDGALADRRVRGLEITGPPMPGGVVGTNVESVVRPRKRNDERELLVAVNAVNNTVYGLYADEDDEHTHHWEVLATLPAEADVSALGSFSGGTVFAATTSTGRMFAIDVGQKSVLELPVQLPKTGPGRRMGAGSFVRIVAFDESSVFAILDGASEQGVPAGGVVASASYVVRLDTLRFVPTLSIGLPDEPLYGLAAVPPAEHGAPRMLVASTDDAVHLSRDDGASWARASAGLPRRAHCGELRAVVGADRRINVYLGTYGRSVFRAQFGLADA